MRRTPGASERSFKAIPSTNCGGSNDASVRLASRQLALRMWKLIDRLAYASGRHREDAAVILQNCGKL